MKTTLQLGHLREKRKKFAMRFKPKMCALSTTATRRRQKNVGRKYAKCAYERTLTESLIPRRKGEMSRFHFQKYCIDNVIAQTLHSTHRERQTESETP